MHDRPDPHLRRIVRSYWAQAHHDRRFDTVFCSDLSTVFLDVFQSVFWKSDHHAGHAVQLAWRVLRSNVNGIGRTVSDARAFDWAWYSLQHGRHGLRGVCAVLRDLVDPSN